MEVANTLNSYKGIKKKSGNIVKNHAILLENLELLDSQLDKLILDIQNNSLPQDSIHNYIEFEAANVSKLSDDIGTFMTDCKFILDTHDAYSEKVRNYTVAFK